MIEISELQKRTDAILIDMEKNNWFNSRISGEAKISYLPDETIKLIPVHYGHELAYKEKKVWRSKNNFGQAEWYYMGEMDILSIKVVPVPRKSELFSVYDEERQCSETKKEEYVECPYCAPDWMGRKDRLFDFFGNWTKCHGDLIAEGIKETIMN